MDEATIISAVSKVVGKRYFDHIKSGGPCPPLDVNVAELLTERHSLLLTQMVDRAVGTEEMVRNRRKVRTDRQYIENYNITDRPDSICGSIGEGFRLHTSDFDIVKVIPNVVVTTYDQLHRIPEDSVNKSILSMGPADCRPGYVTLELLQLGRPSTAVFRKAIVPIGKSRFVSSDIFREGMVDDRRRCDKDLYPVVSNGPCMTVMTSESHGTDYALAFPCISWPKEANEWIHRTRIHGWPTQTMIDRILHEGCHVVAVGDKCSTDTLLQWRISYVYAEKVLVHSLTHSQFRIYGMLKHFLTNIKDLLDHIIGDSDVLCSYFLKTVIFHAVENSPSLLWNEENAVICLRFCLSILIAWVKSDYCPNYFIQNNNMFLRKVHGENRQKLLHFLRDCYDLKWPRMFLSVDAIRVVDMDFLLHVYQFIGSSQYRECERDLDLFEICRNCILDKHQNNLRAPLEASLRCLTVSKTEVDEFIAYRFVVAVLYSIACASCIKYNATCSNKQKYAAIKKSKHVLTPYASMCTCPGLMTLATFHYVTGNYSKTLGMCADMMSTFKLYSDGGVPEQFKERYRKLYCGQENTLYHKLKSGVYTYFTIEEFPLRLPHLHLEFRKHPNNVRIPPLPYATFLSFLCYHDLGDIRRRDTELINLQKANGDSEQGGHRYWIVHTLLGISYQTVGDNRRAIMSFKDSLRVMPRCNPAKERIKALRRSQ